MSAAHQKVKRGQQAKRGYDATRRRARAQQTRRDILDAALRLLLADGYAGTTMAAIAAAAGVSVETLYKSFGSKPQLVHAVYRAGIEGNEALSTEERADRVSREEADPRRRLRRFGSFVAEVTPRVAPLTLLLRTAAESDPEIGRVLASMYDERLRRMTQHAQRLSDGGYLRAGLTVEEARDVLWFYTAPDVYDLLVRQRGWSPERFGRWVGEAYVTALLES